MRCASLLSLLLIAATASAQVVAGPAAGLQLRDATGDPALRFIDIRAVGVRPQALEVGHACQVGDFLDTCDDAAGNVSIGFRFATGNFSFDRLQISTNGFLAVDVANPDNIPEPFPDAGNSTGRIAPFHADWDPRGGSIKTFVQILNDTTVFIAQWTDVLPVWGGPSSTFQVQLWADGRIVFAYLAAATEGPAAIGWEHPEETDGLTLYEGDGSTAPQLAGRVYVIAAAAGGLDPSERETPAVHVVSAAGAAMTAVVAWRFRRPPP